jgi:lincosamide nucleotidyltransferase A/C/D/E
MAAADVLDVLQALAEAGVWASVEGGWGVDALLHRQTRQHGDLDLAGRQEIGAAVPPSLA